MTKVEDYRIKLEDEINSLMKKRDSLVLEMRDIQSKLETLIEQSYALDPTKIRIKCFNCKGTGISPRTSQDGKKQYCEVCGGPDKAYLWAERFTETPKDNAD
jgi:hypothetical protein